MTTLWGSASSEMIHLIKTSIIYKNTFYTTARTIIIYAQTHPHPLLPLVGYPVVQTLHALNSNLLDTWSDTHPRPSHVSEGCYVPQCTAPCSHCQPHMWCDPSIDRAPLRRLHNPASNLRRGIHMITAVNRKREKFNKANQRRCTRF